ncbi:MAG TPA: hypothetical protein VF173_23160 [Thermoanaerobaculia bacterium]|nr:hypothetical protein [Thermoanaerobaculia bacterium]
MSDLVRGGASCRLFTWSQSLSPYPSAAVTAARAGESFAFGGEASTENPVPSGLAEPVLSRHSPIQEVK